MAPRNKENNGRTVKRKMKDSEHPDSGTEDDYRRRRDRNNQAVKRSRVKSRMRTQETLERVHQLKTENDQLEEKIKLLSKELCFLKDLFLAHAGSGHSVNLQDVDLEAILSDNSASALIDIDKTQHATKTTLLNL